MRFLNQYRGLRKELYIIFWGRVVTSMGGLIWPMLTLILKSKLGYSAEEAAKLIIVVGLIQFPSVLLGGKLADHFNKKNIIVVCDLITVVSFILCGILPMSRNLVLLFCIAGIFAELEWPSYDALIANLSTQEERERAYSLNYLGANLGFILAPTLGGILFEHHLGLAFIISGAATFSSTVLIFLFVKDTGPSEETSAGGKYEEADSKTNTAGIFKNAPVLIIFVLSLGMCNALYNVGNGFMMPLNLEMIYGAGGALVFGTLSSVNGITVILGMPVCTVRFSFMSDLSKMITGQMLEILGYVMFMAASGKLPVYYIAMVVFTLGEVFSSLGSKPYITKRVPSSHRGRISSVSTVTGGVFQGLGLYAAGFFADRVDMNFIWAGILLFGGVNLLLMFLMKKKDKIQFPLLY